MKRINRGVVFLILFLLITFGYLFWQHTIIKSDQRIFTEQIELLVDDYQTVIREKNGKLPTDDQSLKQLAREILAKHPNRYDGATDLQLAPTLEEIANCLKQSNLSTIHVTDIQYIKKEYDVYVVKAFIALPQTKKESVMFYFTKQNDTFNLIGTSLWKFASHAMERMGQS